MAASTLRVRARQGITTRYDLIDQGVKRMVGRRLVQHPDSPNGVAWVSTGETETVPNMREFRDAIKDGALWAGDEETAREVFGPAWRENFDASFGTAKAPASAAAPAAEEKAK